MKWTKVLKWFLEFLITTICGDLLVNWSGMAGELARMIPFIELFIPHLAISGILSVIAMNVPFFWKRRPSAKFGSKCINLDSLRNRLPSRSYGGFSQIDLKDYETMKYVSDICQKFKIPYLAIPSMGKPKDDLVHWRIFADNLVRCSVKRDLWEARNLLTPPSPEKPRN